MSKTLVGNPDDMGWESRMLWDKLCEVEHQNQLLLDTMASTMHEISQTVESVPVHITLSLRRLHDQLRGRMSAMRRGVLPHADPNHP